MKRLINFINANVSGKIILFLFILNNAVYLFMWAVTIPKTMEFSKGMKLLDMMPMGYDFNYVRGLFAKLGEIGLGTYLTNQIPADMIYPLFYGLTYCFLMVYILNKLKKLNSPYTYLCLLPLITSVADYFENFGIIIMLSNYPELTEIAVKTTSSFSVLKSISASLFIASLLILLITLGMKTKRTSVRTKSQ